jgi:hypothetical protein
MAPSWSAPTDLLMALPVDSAAIAGPTNEMQAASGASYAPSNSETLVDGPSRVPSQGPPEKEEAERPGHEHFDPEGVAALTYASNNTRGHISYRRIVAG